MLPDIVKRAGITKSIQVQFGGYDRRPEAADGTFRQTENLVVEQLPLLAARKPFYKMDTRPVWPGAESNNAAAMLGGDLLIWCRDDGLVVYDGFPLCYLSGGMKRLVQFGKRVLIWPDKVMLDTSRRILGTALDPSGLPSGNDVHNGDCYAVGALGVGQEQWVLEYVQPDLSVQGSWVDRGPLVTPLEAEITVQTVGIGNGTYQQESARANTLTASVRWTDYFKAGDAVTISGCSTVPGNNQTIIIREIDGGQLRFYENSFRMPDTAVYTVTEQIPGMYDDTHPRLLKAAGNFAGSLVWFTAPDGLQPGDLLVQSGNDILFRRPGEIFGGTIRTYAEKPAGCAAEDQGLELPFLLQPDPLMDYYQETGGITVARIVPDMDFVFEDDNRLWGCKGSEIYASKLGDPSNFNFFDDTADDSWSIQVLSPGDFTGAISHDGYPTFFKQRIRYKVYGSRPDGYQLTALDCEGVLEGAGESLAIVGGILYYLARKGVMADNGAAPRLCSAVFGPVRFGPGVTAAACGDERIYRISIQEGGNNATYSYDTNTGVWLRESGRVYDGFGVVGGVMFAYRETTLWCLGTPPDDNWQEEPITDWSAMAITNDYYLTDPRTGRPAADHKYVYRIQLRGTIEEGGALNIWIRYDSSNTNKLVKSISGQGRKRSWYLPVHLRRCDHFRLQLGGRGFVVQSLALETKLGSAKQNR